MWFDQQNTARSKSAVLCQKYQPGAIHVQNARAKVHGLFTPAEIKKTAGIKPSMCGPYKSEYLQITNFCNRTRNQKQKPSMNSAQISEYRFLKQNQKSKKK